VRLWHIVRSRCRTLFFRGGRESDLREEWQFHLERETERLEAAGMHPDSARQQALKMLGSVEQLKEECRDARGTAVVDGLIRDRYIADFVVFNPATVKDTATYERPHQYPTGIEYVVVNGVTVLDPKGLTGARPGRPVYGPARQP